VPYRPLNEAPAIGWINYYSHFYKSALAWTLRRVDAFLIRWARNKFKRLRLRPRGAREWFSRVVRDQPSRFAHWGFLHVDDRTSGAVRREPQARF
jgi:RNA-directed DNA polymerase